MSTSENHYKRIIEAMSEGFAYCRMIFDEAGVPIDLEYLEVNDAFGRLTGLKDVEGKLVSEVIPGHRDTNAELFDAYGRVVSTGVPEEFDVDVKALGLQLHLSIYRPEPGHFVAMFTDVTDRTRAERELRESQHFVSSILDTSPNLIYIYDIVENRNVYTNREVTEFLGYTSEQIAAFGSHLFENILHPGDAAHVGVHHARFADAADGDVLEVEYRMKHSSGQWRWLRSRDVAFARDDQGRVTQILGFTEDFTRRRLAEDEIKRMNRELEACVQERTAELTATNRELLLVNIELRESNLELETATRAKSDFLTAVSHELRTPLNSIIGFSGILLKGLAGPLNEEQELQVGMVSEAGKYLLSLIDDILDLSKIESGRGSTTLEEFDVSALAADALEMVRPLADAKGIELRFVSEAGSTPLTSDPRCVSQILTNLLSNAIKFTESGTVSLGISAGEERVGFSVADTGQGIRAEDLSHIMESFYQAESLVAAKSEGTGLGLAISSQLAEALGGTLEVSSEFGVGSTFTLWVPRSRRADI